MDAVRSHPWPRQEPYFERLDLRVDLPGYECRLDVGHECVSTYEAMHEDLYFGLLEFFQKHSGRPPGDRRLQPGQIVPDVRRAAPGTAPRVRVELRAFDTGAQDAAAWADTDADQPLEALGKAPSAARIALELDLLGGDAFVARSRQGRSIGWRYLHGSRFPVLVSGGQHANETSGVVGALRAGHALAAQPGAHFALLPLKNPDGYALHRELGAHHPCHMQHAARYTALGDDLEYREGAPLYEREAVEQALAVSGAQLHLNLHGYPAHEWTRPLTGYIPLGFDLWTIPKGFFLILRHHPGWDGRARELLERVAAELRNVPGLPEFNARQMALYERHAGPLTFEQIHGTAVTVSETPHGTPVTLITEFPRRNRPWRSIPLRARRAMRGGARGRAGVAGHHGRPLRAPAGPAARLARDMHSTSAEVGASGSHPGCPSPAPRLHSMRPWRPVSAFAVPGRTALPG